MTDIKLACPHCCQPLEVPPDMADESLDCHACEKKITVSCPPMPTAATEHPSPAPLPYSKTTPKTSPPYLSLFQRKFTLNWVIGTGVVLIVAYIVWPYITVWQLYTALRSENADTISSFIDFPSLRTSLKDQTNALLQQFALE